MKNVCLIAIFILVVCATAIEFDQQHQISLVDDYSYDGPVEESSRHHGKHKKLKKLKKRLLLQCLLGQAHLRRRRDTTDPTGRFLLPFVQQNTNVNVGGQGGGAYGDPQYGSYGGSGCMQMLNTHGPLGSSMEDTGPVGFGSRNGLYQDWNRYARQFHRNIVRPIYRLF